MARNGELFPEIYSALSKLTDILNNLLKKDVECRWTDAHQWVFEEHERRLTSATILNHFNPNEPSEVHTDASAVGVGAVLIQRKNGGKHAFAYASKFLNKAQRNYGATKLKHFAVVFAVEKFHFYLEGAQPFKVVSGHAAIGALLNTKNPTSRLIKCARLCGLRPICSK